MEIAATVALIIYALGVLTFVYGIGYICGKEPGWFTKDKLLKSFIIIPLWPFMLAMEAAEALLKLPFKLGKKSGEKHAAARSNDNG